MDKKICSRCGQEIPDGEGLPCPECGKEAGCKSMKRRCCFAGVAVLLVIAGAVLWRAHAVAWDFSWAALTGRPVAMVNGEAVSRADFCERARIHRAMVERQYGKGLFAGDEGKGLLAELESDVLEKMIGERLVEQESRRLNLAVSDEQVRQALDAIGQEVYGSRENLQASLREEGISPEYLSGHIRNMLLRKEVEQAQRAGEVNGSSPPGLWLIRARQEARITLNKAIDPSRTPTRGAGSCCGSSGDAGRGGCGAAQPSGSEAAPELRNEAAAAALAAYRKANPAGKDPQTRITDYGCHLQVDIEEGGKVVRSYNVQGGTVSEI